MQAFDKAHRAVHYPNDRRFRVRIAPRVLIVIAVIVSTSVLAAWIQYWIAGLPGGLVIPNVDPLAPPEPNGFPLWLRLSHFLNFFFLMLLIRSGLSILMDHPRLYFNDHCTPGTEWIRMTPLDVPQDRMWTAKDDARYITPIVATPGYRHTVGIARVWHFINVHGFILTGVVYYTMLFVTSQWRRIVPVSFDVIPAAWKTWVCYASFHFPPEPNGFYSYNALQLIAYFVVVFVFGPLAIATGIAMSPAVVNRFPWYARLFGGRQCARSIHFLTMLSFAGFIAVHVSLVALTGFARNMNHIVLGTDDWGRSGMIIGLSAIALVGLSWIGAHYLSWHKPRMLQHALKTVTYPMQLLTLNRLVPVSHYTIKDISPHFWPNGKLPVSDHYKKLSSNGFKDYRLKVGGMVGNPVELSLSDIAALCHDEQITMHHCIQGWSGIAQWSGIPMSKLIALVRPSSNVKTVAFFSFGEALYGGPYYDTQSMENAMKPQCLLATHMNGEPLTEIYGAPLRLRVENQLGYKMVKWIERIEFVESEKELGKGEGGVNEDDEYFDLLPNI